MDIHGDDYWWYKGKKSFIQKLIRNIELPRNGRVLDLGCGTGTLLPYLQQWGDLTGLELSGEALARARARFSGNLVQASSMAVPFRDGSFSVICIFDCLEHFKDDRTALQQTQRLLTKNGVLILSVPAFNQLRVSRDDQLHHYRRYTKHNLSHLLQETGFELHTMFYGYLCLTFPIVLQVLKEKWMGPPAVLPSDIKNIREPFNTIMAGWLKWEAQLAGSVGLPVGTSLFAAATKRNDPS